MTQRETACIKPPPGPSLLTKIQNYFKDKNENLRLWWRFHKEDLFGLVAALVIVSLVSCCLIGVTNGDIPVTVPMPSASSGDDHHHHRSSMHHGSLLHRSSSRRNRRR